VDALVQEITLRSKELQMPLSSIYFGGGTPSTLSVAQLSHLFDAIHTHFQIDPHAEITLEANPDDLSIEHLQTLKQLGVNRLSIGIQSFRQEDLTFMNRAHSAEQALQCVVDAHHVGFDQMSVDLIYGSPGLTDAAWIENLQMAAALPINHLSCYALTVEKGTPLDKQIRLGKEKSPEEEQAARQFELLHDWSESAGFEHYEISNLARPGARAKHNSGYWKGFPYIGIGPSAHSFSGNSRRMNVANNQKYISSLHTGDCLNEREVIDEAMRYNELVLTGLRTTNGILKSDLKSLDPAYFRYFQEQIKKSNISLIETETSFVLPAREWLFADGIASDLFFV